MFDAAIKLFFLYENEVVKSYKIKQILCFNWMNNWWGGDRWTKWVLRRKNSLIRVITNLALVLYHSDQAFSILKVTDTFFLFWNTCSRPVGPATILSLDQSSFGRFWSKPTASVSWLIPRRNSEIRFNPLVSENIMDHLNCKSCITAMPEKIASIHVLFLLHGTPCSSQWSC
mgnify:CR=1 FL=1